VQIKNHLIYHPILNGMLKGYYFNSSGFSADQFEIMAFVMPLYVPSDSISLDFGDSLRSPLKRQWWEYKEDRLEQLGHELAVVMNKADRDFLSKISDAECFYHYYRGKKKLSYSFFEAVSYSAAYADLKGSEGDLKDCLAYIKKKEDLDNPYIKKVYENTLLLINGDRKTILSTWEGETRAKLKL